MLADLIDRVNNNGDELKQTQLCKFTNRILGDVTLGSTWAPFWGATEKDAQKLRRAKDLVNSWFNQRIIETFFDVCVQDRFRKDFWLDYVDKLSGFRIVGSTETKRLLQSDSRIGSMVLRYFIETDSMNSQTSALVLFINNKMLVEFSDTGALYAYNKGHHKVRTVLDRRINIASTNDLKIPSMGNLITIGNWASSYYYADEGRMTHQGDWQSRLRGWMSFKVLSSQNSESFSFDSEDEELFQARPIPKEEFKPSLESYKSIRKDAIMDLPNIKRQSELQETQLKAIVYEENIGYSIASRLLFDGKCRVVLGQSGFFLNIDQGRKFVNIYAPARKSLSGNIWIKRSNLKGWQEIVHAFCGKENVIGFIRQVGDCIWFKHELNQPDFMNIKLY